MKLFIAEKPSLGRAIADGIGVLERHESHLVCRNDCIVTWCYGHMLELYFPPDYDPKYKDWRQLPVIPSKWKKKPIEKSQKQLNAISRLLVGVDCVVNAGDPDREGQIIVDEVLEYCGYEGKTERIWLAALDDRSVKKALDNLKSNDDYIPLRKAAQARSQADWLIGINATRALTNLGRDCGFTQLLSLGRVQTPVLALVANRDLAIKNFKPRDYIVLEALMEHEKGSFKARFLAPDGMEGLDEEGRLVNPQIAHQILEQVQGKTGNILDLSSEEKSKNPPLPFNLSVLQKQASARFGMTAQQVLNTCQSLYEKKLTSYPRTDCQYLPNEQLPDAKGILEKLSHVSGLEEAAKNADPGLKSRAWNTGKITAHHAIIPTGETPSGLTETERNIYGMIALAYILQFYPPMKYTAQKISVNIAETVWNAQGRVIKDPGWTRAQKEEEDEDSQKEKEENQKLPSCFKGDPVKCASVDSLAKKTSPPARFTEGTLIEAMSNIHRFIDDPEAKKILKENEGIGTEATRADILEKLKKNGYLVPKGKQIMASDLAYEVLDVTPDGLKDPVTTAQWETRLSGIAQGKNDIESFMNDQIEILPLLLEPLIKGEKRMKPKGPVFECPECGKPLEKRKGKFGIYWSCTRLELHKDGKYVNLPDDKGKPGKKSERSETETDEKCLSCGNTLTRISGNRKDGSAYDYFSCPSCNATFDCVDGKAVEKKRHSETTDTEHKCLKCKKKNLQRIKGTREDGTAYDFFKCPGCGASFNVKDDAPVERAKVEKTSFKCPKCKKPLVRREFTRKKDGVKYFMYCCTGYPNCKEQYFEGRDGKPNFDYKRKDS